MKLLESNEPLSLNIPLYEGGEMYYRSESNARVPDGFRKVCWYDEEPDLGPAIVLNLKNILREKIKAAQADYDAL